MAKATKRFNIFCFIIGVVGFLFLSEASYAYPVFAQAAYQNPREMTGKIVCANCHLAEKSIDIEVPRAVLPDTVFEAVVRIPYETTKKQLGADGNRVGLNIGAVVVLPEGFRIAPKDRLTDAIGEKVGGFFIQPYSKEQTNILVVGPLSGDKEGRLTEIDFPIISPDPSQNKNVSFLNYPIYVGGNRGRGQLYPTGEKSNNNMYTSVVSGKIMGIESIGKGRQNILVATGDGEVTQTLPSGLEVSVKLGDVVKNGQSLTLDPNVGGFGQEESAIVLQDPGRVESLVIFIFAVILSQIFLVVKKKKNLKS
jgi:apocytochrome f